MGGKFDFKRHDRFDGVTHVAVSQSALVDRQQVLPLQLESSAHFRAVGPVQLVQPRGSGLQVVSRVAPFGVAARAERVQLLLDVDANALEQTEAALADESAHRRHHDEGLVVQRLQHLEGVELGRTFVHHRREGGQREPSSEYRAARQRPLCILR